MLVQAASPMDVEAGDLLKSLRTTNEEARKSALARPPGGSESSPLLLLRRARDEAHATALAGHRHLRETAALASAIDTLGTAGALWRCSRRTRRAKSSRWWTFASRR